MMRLMAKFGRSTSRSANLLVWTGCRKELDGIATKSSNLGLCLLEYFTKVSYNITKRDWHAALSRIYQRRLPQ